MRKFRVPMKKGGVRLLTFLHEKLGEKFSVRQIKKFVDAGRLRLNGKLERFSSKKVAVGDQIEIDLTPLVQKKMELHVLYEDSHLILIDKPAGLVVDQKKVEAFFKKKIYLVHRLDKETSGILILAKTHDAMKKMEKLFFERKVTKKYLAVVKGKMKKKEGRIETYLAKVKAYQGQALWGSVTRSKGESAITEWKVVGIGSSTTLVECVPKTGRTHQIRVHLYEIGYPIVGDKQYGREIPCKIHSDRHLLHAKEIAFMHPFLEKKIAITCPPPAEFTLEKHQKIG